tara:strand:- start:490 stop:1089 length:600 start_codon:yes stop_codon:yes gene_type:complete
MTAKENERITDFIIRYEKIFSRDECRELIETIDFYDENCLLFPQNPTNRPFQDQDAINVMSDDGITLSSAFGVARKILPKIAPCIDQYLEQFPILGLRKFLLHDCKIKKIKCGGGFHAWHYENGTVDDARRTFVIQVYLNDDFDGGETEFLYQNKREKASAGDVLIFPCQYTHVHRGNPPIDGDKYLVTSWAWIQSDKL